MHVVVLHLRSKNIKGFLAKRMQAEGGKCTQSLVCQRLREKEAQPPPPKKKTHTRAQIARDRQARAAHLYKWLEELIKEWRKGGAKLVHHMDN